MDHAQINRMIVGALRNLSTETEICTLTNTMIIRLKLVDEVISEEYVTLPTT